MFANFALPFSIECIYQKCAFSNLQSLLGQNLQKHNTKCVSLYCDDATLAEKLFAKLYLQNVTVSKILLLMLYNIFSFLCIF